MRKKEVKLWWIMRNKFYQRLRHLVMESDGEYYLIDKDKSTFLLGYLCPIFHWTLTHTVMKINLPVEEVNRLLLSKEFQGEKQRGNRNVIWVIVAFSVLLLPRLYDFINNFHRDIPFEARLLIFVFGITLVGTLRTYTSLNSRLIPKVIGDTNLSEVKIRIYPTTIKSKLKRAAVLYINYLIIIGALAGFLSFGGWMFLIVGLSMLLIISFGNTMLLTLETNTVEFLEV